MFSETVDRSVIKQKITIAAADNLFLTHESIPNFIKSGTKHLSIHLSHNQLIVSIELGACPRIGSWLNK